MENGQGMIREREWRGSQSSDFGWNSKVGMQEFQRRNNVVEKTETVKKAQQQAQFSPVMLNSLPQNYATEVEIPIEGQLNVNENEVMNVAERRGRELAEGVKQLTGRAESPQDIMMQAIMMRGAKNGTGRN